MNENSEYISDEVLAELWDRFGRDYAQLGYRRKSHELFAKYLANDFPRLGLTGQEIKRRLHTYKKRLRDQAKRKPS